MWPHVHVTALRDPRQGPARPHGPRGVPDARILPARQRHGAHRVGPRPGRAVRPPAQNRVARSRAARAALLWRAHRITPPNPIDSRSTHEERHARTPRHHDSATGEGRRAGRVPSQRRNRSRPRANDDCVVFLVGRSATDNDVVYVTEGWTSKEAHETFFAGEAANAVLAGIEPLLAGDTRYLDEVPVGGKFAIGSQ